MQDEKDMDPTLRVKRQVIRLGQNIFYTSNLLRMRVTVQDRPVKLTKFGRTVMAGGMVSTNGVELNFHPEYVRRVDDDRLAYHIKKAVLQIALKHNLVKDKYPKDTDPNVISMASSLAVNHILMHEDGIPDDAPMAGKAETFFSKLNPGKPMEHYVEALFAAIEKQKKRQEQRQKQKQDKGEENDDDSEGQDGEESDEGGEGEGKSGKGKGKGGKGKGGTGDSEQDEESEGDEGENEEGDEDQDGSEDGAEEDRDDDSEEATDEPSSGDAESGNDQDDDRDSGDGEGRDESEEGEDEPEPIDWDKLPKQMAVGDVQQHPEANGDNDEQLRSENDQELAATLAACDGAGDAPGEIVELVKAALKPSKLNYKTMLRRFCLSMTSKGFTYSRPNRRSSWRKDVIIPARKSRGVGHIVFAVDTSGSMQGEDINRALDEIEGIFKAWPETKITMIEADERIVSEVSVKACEMVALKKDKSWRGRGGTDFRPAFRRAAELPNVRCVIYLTDLEGPKPPKHEVKIPTLWLDVRGRYEKGSHFYPDFGEVAVLDKDDE